MTAVGAAIPSKILAGAEGFSGPSCRKYLACSADTSSAKPANCRRKLLPTAGPECSRTLISAFVELSST